jgi:hypothetical protein
MPAQTRSRGAWQNGAPPQTAPDLVHHSERGSPCASDAYRKALADLGIVQSMSRDGTPSRLPAELVDHRRYANALLCCSTRSC